MAEKELPKLVQLWNQHCGSLKSIKRLTPGGEVWKKAEKFWHENPDEEGWIETIQAIARCSWCVGRRPLSDGKPWHATFAYLLRLETFDKAQMGFFDESHDKPVSKIAEEPAFVPDQEVAEENAAKVREITGSLFRSMK